MISIWILLTSLSLGAWPVQAWHGRDRSIGHSGQTVALIADSGERYRFVCAEVSGAPFAPYSTGEISAPREGLCHVVHDWYVWHAGAFVGYPDQTPAYKQDRYAGPDFLFSQLNGQLEQYWRVSVDSMVRLKEDSTTGVVYLSAYTGRSQKDTHVLLRWRVLRTRAVSGASQFSLDDSQFQRVPGTRSDMDVGATAEAAPRIRLSVLERQVDWVRQMRKSFGLTADLLFPTMLIGGREDTAMAALGVIEARTPSYAALWVERRLMFSPVGATGGVDQHELAHLVHPNDRPINRHFGEAFAVMMGGVAGRPTAEELCHVRRDPQTPPGWPRVSPGDAIASFDHPGKLLLARAIAVALRQMPDSTDFFAATLWRVNNNPWHDLQRVSGVPARQLAARAIAEVDSIAVTCGGGRR